jgi:pimeloyl-ACP methyl ester carboxylesterase
MAGKTGRPGRKPPPPVLGGRNLGRAADLASMLSDLPRRSIAIGDDQSLCFHQAGSGLDVVLLHGLITTSCEMVISLFDALTPHSRVTAFDRPGHGGSTRRRFEAAPQQQAARLLEGMRALELERPVLVGHSLGATIALTAALLAEDSLAGVVAIAPVVFPEPRLEQMIFGARSTPGLGDMAALVDDAGPDTATLPLLWEAMFLPQKMPPLFRDTFPFEEVKTGKAMLATGEEVMATPPALAANFLRYASCRLPVTILMGDEDIVVSPHRHGRVLAGMLPNARPVPVPGFGHMLHHFEPERVAEAVRDVMERGARRETPLG